MDNLVARTHLKGTVPVDFRLIAYGCFWGLVLGLISFYGLTSCECGGDVDLAVSRGIAGFVSIAVGIFIGTKLALLAMKAFRVWIVSLMSRVNTCQERLSRLSGEVEPDNSSEERSGVSSFYAVRLRIYFIGLAVGCCGVGVDLMALIIRAGTTGIYESGSLPITAYVGLAVASAGIAGIALELNMIARSVSRIEGRLNDAEGVAVAPLEVRPQYADAAIQSTQSWVHKITGVRGWQPSMVPA